MKFIVSIISIIFLFFIILDFLFISKTNKIKDLKEDELWDSFIKEYDNFVYEGIVEKSKQKENFIVFWNFKNRYRIFVQVKNKKAISFIYTWDENFSDSYIILSSYNEEKSKKLANLLITKLLEENNIEINTIK